MAAGDMCWLLGVTPGAEEGGGGEEEPELGRARHPVHVHAGGGRGRGELQGGGGGGGAPDDEGGGQHQGAVHRPQCRLGRGHTVCSWVTAASPAPRPRPCCRSPPGTSPPPAQSRAAGRGRQRRRTPPPVHTGPWSMVLVWCGVRSGGAAPSARPPLWQTASRPR